MERRETHGSRAFVFACPAPRRGEPDRFAIWRGQETGISEKPDRDRREETERHKRTQDTQSVREFHALPPADVSAFWGTARGTRGSDVRDTRFVCSAHRLQCAFRTPPAECGPPGTKGEPARQGPRRQLKCRKQDCSMPSEKDRAMQHRNERWTRASGTELRNRTSKARCCYAVRCIRKNVDAQQFSAPRTEASAFRETRDGLPHSRRFRNRSRPRRRVFRDRAFRDGASTRRSKASPPAR